MISTRLPQALVFLLLSSVVTVRPAAAAENALTRAKDLYASAAYEDALRLDPGNATAWGELAMAYEASAGYLPPSEAIEKSCAAAERARSLEMQVAERAVCRADASASEGDAGLRLPAPAGSSPLKSASVSRISASQG